MIDNIDTCKQIVNSSLFSNGPIVVFIWKNEEGWPVEDVSLNIENLYGYSPEEYKTASLVYSDQIHPDDLSTVFDEVTNASKNNENIVSHKPYRYKARNGRYHWVNDNTTILRDEEGNVTHYVGYLTDISDYTDSQIKLQARNKEFKELNETLEQRVKEEVAKNQEHAKNRLEYMRRTVSMIAHQWRQPLTALGLIIQKIDLQYSRKRLNDTLMKESSEKAFSLINLMSSTVDDFRNFYKPSQKPVTAKLEDVISTALNVIENALLNSNIKIIKEYRDDLEVELYANELVQVTLNILNNAQDNFIEKQTKNPTIKIITQNKTITIYDNGGGVPKDIIEEIFDPYFSTKDNKNGTGLGLYMSKLIIDDHHNGELNVENTGDGVCFEIKLDTCIN